MSNARSRAASDARSPAAYATVNAVRAFNDGTAARKRNTSSPLNITGNRRGVRA